MIVRYLLFLLITLSVSPCYAQFIDSVEAEKEQSADLHTKIDIHFNFELSKWDHQGNYWKKHLDKTWFTPWSEWVSKSNLDVSQDKIKAIDERITDIKSRVNVIVHTDDTMPYRAFCVLPRGYKVTQLSGWVEIPKDTIPTLMFFVDWFDFLSKEYTYEDDRKKWLREMKKNDQQRYYEEQAKAFYYAVRWAKQQKELIRVDWVSLYEHQRFHVTQYDENYNTKRYYVELSSTGYERSPAVAWDAPPVLPENPMKYGLIKNPLE